MTTPTVALTVDCNCAAQDKCFVSELVAVAEHSTVPLTWLIDVSEHDPISNVKLYHNEYFHRIPAWHEVGLHVTFDAGAGSTVQRADLIRIGKDILKQFSIKPTAFRAGCGNLDAADLRALEDVGILVDSTPGASASQPPGSPTAPYHPSYSNLYQAGDAKLWIVPVAYGDGVRGYLDEGFDRLKPVIDQRLEACAFLTLAMSDCKDTKDSLRHVVDYLKRRKARFVTLTQLITEL